MIRPLHRLELPDTYRNGSLFHQGDRCRPFPVLDRAFDAVERALAQLGVEDPALLRTPRPVEEALSPTALPEGTLLILSPSELRAAEIDIEDTVKDERQRGTAYVTLPRPSEMPGRARGLRELASAAITFGFYRDPQPAVPSRIGRVTQVALPLELYDYRILLADTRGFRVMVVARALPRGGSIGLWSGNERLLREVRDVLAGLASAAGHAVPPVSRAVPRLEGIDSEEDVWQHAAQLRAHRVVREAELREIARAAALRGVALRREREAARRRAAGA